MKRCHHPAVCPNRTVRPDTVLSWMCTRGQGRAEPSLLMTPENDVAATSTISVLFFFLTNRSILSYLN